MASQGSSSNEVLTLISDVTDQDVVSQDVNVHYVKVTLPSGKMVTKCLFCDKIWERIVSTTKKGHLSNKQLAKDYSTTFCHGVPKHVSDFFVDQLVKLKQKKADQLNRQENIENRLSFEKANTDFGPKRLRQTTINEIVDYEAIGLADRKVARYIFMIFSCRLQQIIL
jgi:hypothetical protein